MNCSECDQPLARWGKWYWICIHCKRVTFTSWFAELRANWFIFVRYTLMISVFSMVVGIVLGHNPFIAFGLGTIFGGFIGLSLKKIRRDR